MFNQWKAADMAAYLLFRAGAEGLPRRKLLLLLYLTERQTISQYGCSMADDDFTLTPFGPVMRNASSSIMGGSRQAGKAWKRRLEWSAAEQHAAMVAEHSVEYQATAHADAQRIKLRQPQPPCPYPDSNHSHSTQGMPYLGELSRSDERTLDAVWTEHGEHDQQLLAQHALELPEVDRKTNGKLPLKAVLEGLQFSPRQVKMCLDLKQEMHQADAIFGPECGVYDGEDQED